MSNEIELTSLDVIDRHIYTLLADGIHETSIRVQVAKTARAAHGLKKQNEVLKELLNTALSKLDPSIGGAR